VAAKSAMVFVIVVQLAISNLKQSFLLNVAPECRLIGFVVERIVMSDLQRHIGQKLALAAAVVCSALTLPVFGLFLWFLRERGMADSWTPSALTTVFFLGFCAIVLYVISRPQPPLPTSDTPQ
jgi:uncharacterized membrane protein